MLAKEIKIKTLKKQREFIEEQLKNIPEGRDDGDSAYSYVGYVYPEVIKHFEKEGFTVTNVNSDMMLVATRGLPVYLFTVGDTELSKEELKQAEEYKPVKKQKDVFDEDPYGENFPDFFKGLLS